MFEKKEDSLKYVNYVRKMLEAKVTRKTGKKSVTPLQEYSSTRGIARTPQTSKMESFIKNN